MKNNITDEFATTAIILTQLLKKLELCQQEKIRILQEIDRLKAENMLEENFPYIREKMDKNLNDFSKVVEKIKKLKTLQNKKEG